MIKTHLKESSKCFFCSYPKVNSISAKVNDFEFNKPKQISLSSLSAVFKSSIKSFLHFVCDNLTEISYRHSYAFIKYAEETPSLLPKTMSSFKIQLFSLQFFIY